MDKIVYNEAIFNDESPFHVFTVEQYVATHTGRTFFFKEWIRHSYDPTESVIVLTANDGTDNTVQVKILRNESGYYLGTPRISKLSL